MKTKIVMLLITAFMSSSSFAQKEGKEIKQMICSVNMDCMSCKNKIEKNIAFEKGVKDISADVSTNTVIVKYRADKNTAEEISKAISELGYESQIKEDKVLEK